MRKYLLILIFFLVIKAALIIYGILNWGVGLGPDEAQYWTWSQSLAWGYYSKPPAIAWQIWLGTKLFGNTELGVRFIAVVLGFLLPVAVFFLSLACKLLPRTAFWAGMIMAFSPLGFVSSIFATTDAGMVLFWTLGCLVIATALAQEKSPNYFLFGAVILLGALYKWPIYILWVLVVFGMAFIPLLRDKNILAGMVISLFGLTPSFIWNSTHDWATFRHVFATIKVDNSTTKLPLIHGNFFEFVGAQAVLLFPIFFVLLILALLYLYKRRKKINSALIFCGWVTAALLGSYCLLSIFKKMQGNWCVFAYPTAMVLVAWYACECVKKARIWLWLGVTLSAILSLYVFSNARTMPFRYNPFKHNLGWEQLGSVLTKAGYNQSHFLFGDKYQMSSELSFYSPQQQRAYFLNINGTRKNQFSYWPSLKDEQMGKTGFFVLAENLPYLKKLDDQEIEAYGKKLQPFFEKIQLVGLYPLVEQAGQISKGALIFKCINYNGLEPPEKQLY